ncbi:hypothetical protein P2R59_22130, partial [Escherichia coli]
LMMSLWDALRMNMMISYQELVRTFLSLCMSKRTDTFLFVLIQKISSVGVQTGVVLYGCVTLLMTSFDVQQHHGAARHFTSVSAIAQEQIFPNWDMPANCW